MASGSRFGIFWRPIFRGKSDAPELGTARGKFQTDFTLIAADRPEKNDAAFLFFFCGVVAQHHQAAAGDACLQQDQSAVRIDGERICLFIEIFALCVDAVKANANLHEYALTSAAGTCVGWITWKL